MNLIAAVDKNWAIGKNNELLVSIPNDMKMFRQMTTGKVVVMGRKTLESFPNGLPLKHRVNIVLTKNQKYQVMLKKCTPFPYGRTEKAYEEALDAAGEYRRIWQEIRQNVLQMATEQNNAALKRDAMERDEQQLDDAFVEKRGYTTKRKECEIQIRQYEDYLSRPDIAEKANRLKELREELKQIERDTASLREGLAVFADRLNLLERE